MFLKMGHWLDILTVTIAILCIFIRPIRRYRSKTFPLTDHRMAGNDFLNGLAVTPFIFLAFSILSDWVLDEIKNSSRVMITAAGVLGFIYILKELLFEDK